MIPWEKFETPLDAYEWAKANASRLMFRPGWYTTGIHLLGIRGEKGEKVGFVDWIGGDGRRV